MKRAVNKIVKKKNRVLSVFHKTRDSLISLIGDIDKEHVVCDDNIEVLSQSIVDEKSAKSALDVEKDMAMNTIKNIEQIIGK